MHEYIFIIAREFAHYIHYNKQTIAYTGDSIRRKNVCRMAKAIGMRVKIQLADAMLKSLKQTNAKYKLHT